MALIRLDEAAALGLLPPEMMRFFPAVGRSRLFGSPLTLNLRQFRPGAGPLERGVGRFGFQHGVPGIAGLRFGLGPLMQGLGLSPGPSAVTAPGVVPGGRAQAGRGGAPSAATLAARAQPQDIEAIRRLLETGQLDPRALPPGLVAALVGGAAPRPSPTRATRPPPPSAAGPSGIAEPLAQTKQALTAAGHVERIIRALGGVPPGSAALPPSAALEAQRLGEREPFGAGVVPSGLSVEATRTLEGVLGPLSPEEVASLTPENIAQLEAFAREVRGGVLPGSVPPADVAAETAGAAAEQAGTAGGEAGAVPTPGGGLPLPSAGQTLEWLLAALQLAQGGQQFAAGQTIPGALSLARGGLQVGRQAFPKAFQPPSGTLSVGQVARQAAGNILTGTSGGATLAANEAAREALLAGGQAGTQAAPSLAGALPLANIALTGVGLGLGPKGELAPREGESFGSAFPRAFASPEAQIAGLIGGPVLSAVVAAAKAAGLFGAHRSLQAKLQAELLEAGRIGDTIRGPMGRLNTATTFEEFFTQSPHVGYFQRPAEFIRRALTDPNSIMAASAPGGRWDQPSAMGVRTSLLGPSVQAIVRAAIRNAARLAEQPDALASLARSEYAAQRRAIERRFMLPPAQVFGPGDIGELIGGPEEDPARRQVLAEQRTQQAVAERQRSLATTRPQMIEALAALERQFQADPYSVLPPDFQALRPPSAPETIPPSPAAPPPAPSAPGAVPPEASLPGLPPLPSLQRGGVVPQGGAYRLEAGEVVVPANGGRVIETRKDGNLYVPVDGGAPERAKKNPDPARFWRVVMSSQEAQDAIRSGDPAETPILANLGTMLMGPQKRAASLEFLRRAQHQNPAGTLGDMLAMHEQSETVQDAQGRWINIHGQTRQPLLPKHEFERPSYGTTEEAVSAAQMRSQMEDPGDFPSRLPAGLRPPIYMLPRLDPMDFRRENEEPAGGGREAIRLAQAMSLEQMQRNILENYADRITEMEEASRETGVFPVRPFLAPPPTLPTPSPRFPMPRAIPRGGLVPSGI